MESKEERVELWLPTTTTTVTVVDGEVTIRDSMVMEKKIIKRPAGFDRKEER